MVGRGDVTEEVSKTGTILWEIFSDLQVCHPLSPMLITNVFSFTISLNASDCAQNNCKFMPHH